MASNLSMAPEHAAEISDISCRQRQRTRLILHNLQERR